MLDTKWKVLSANDDRKLGVVQDDFYQVLVYGQAYDAERLVLLYLRRGGLEKGIVKSWRVQGTQTRLDVVTVDVGQPASVACTLREIVRTA